MSYAIKIVHWPTDSRYTAAMYKDGKYVVGSLVYGATRKDAANACADLFEAGRNAEPTEWITYIPVA